LNYSIFNVFHTMKSLCIILFGLLMLSA
jgi:hypothetical protein